MSFLVDVGYIPSMIASWIGIIFSGVGVVMGVFPSLVACQELRYAIVSFCGLVFLGATSHLTCHGWKNARAKYREWQLKRHSLAIELSRYSTMLAVMLAEVERKSDFVKKNGAPERMHSWIEKCNYGGVIEDYKQKILPCILRLLKRTRWLGFSVRSMRKRCSSVETAADLLSVADELKALTDKAAKRLDGKR